MELPPQPPPDAPAPPPGPEAIRSRAWMKGILWAGGLSLFFLLLSSPVVLKSKTAPERTQAIGSMKQVVLALLEFDLEYGSFPDATTIGAVKAKTSTTLALGSSTSNDLFRQLLPQFVSREKVFWAKTPSTPRKPDDILGPGALKKGECAFTYIAGRSASGDPGTPIVMAPVIHGTWEFDPKPFQGKALVLRIDGSVRQETIDPHGHVMIHGMNLFDPRQPYWNGTPPDIKWPE